MKTALLCFALAAQGANPVARRPAALQPALSFSTFLGGADDADMADRGMAVAVDAGGSIYIAGNTGALDFPTTPGAYQPRPRGTTNQARAEVFVAKLDPAGSKIVYATYLGGSGRDYVTGIAVDAQGNAYLSGYTDSPDFPVVNAVQGTRRGAQDAFVAKLNPDGSALVYSTYLGGSGDDLARAIAIDASGEAVVAGGTTSADFPTSEGAAGRTYGGSGDAFASRLSASGSRLVYSTYLGGSGPDEARGIALDGDGNAYAGGTTGSNNFPVRNALQAARAGGEDLFLAKLAASGAEVVFSTYLGGQGNEAAGGVAVDREGNIHFTGRTESRDFPLRNPSQAGFGGGFVDAVLMKVAADGRTLLYSTYLGGSGIDAGEDVAADAGGQAYVTGFTDSADFPALGLPAVTGNQGDGAFAVKFESGGSPVYTILLGGNRQDQGLGIAVDAGGAAYVTGGTLSGDFPAVNARQAAMAGSGDAFLFRISGGLAPKTIASFSAASFAADLAAPESIVTSFGENLAGSMEGASPPLPLELAGVSVRVQDAGGAARTAELYLASPGQINYVVPAGTTPGTAAVTVMRGGEAVASGTLQVAPAAPGVFSANAQGSGAASAYYRRVTADGLRLEGLTFDPATGSPAPLDLGQPGDRLYVLLLATGVRGFAEGVRATVGGQAAPVAEVSPQPDFPGLDVVTLGPLPRALGGSGVVSVELQVDGKAANPVTIRIK